MRETARTRPHAAHRLLRGAGTGALLALALAACSSTPAHAPAMPGMPGMASSSAVAPASASAAMGATGGMGDPMYTGNGLAPSASGLTLVPAAAWSGLPSATPVALTFRITDAAGTAVTAFDPDQTKLMHFYVVRTDLTGYQHVHPVMNPGGTWSASLATLEPGTYRAYASFLTQGPAGAPTALVLSDPFTVTGQAATTPLPATAPTTQVDGYTVTIGGDLTAGMAHTLTATIAKDGVPVTDLQPYLDSYAHLTAFHAGDLAFAHLHPQGAATGDHGGPTLTFDATLPESGDYRLFLQFQTDAVLHTAAITLHVG